MATKHRLSEKQKLAILNEIANKVNSSIELEVVLQTALLKVLEVFQVQAGGIYLLNKRTNQLELSVWRNLSNAFLSKKSSVKIGSGCAGWAALHQEVFAAREHLDEARFVCEDSEQLMGIDCLVAAPIKAKNQVLGVIELFAPVSRRLTADEEEMIQLISDHIGIAIENAQLYSDLRNYIVKLKKLQIDLEEANKELQAHLHREAYIAETLQKSLLPQKLPQINGYALASRHLSATVAANVGGDFYDFLEFSSEKLGFVVGDVCGSGIEAATMTSLAKNTIRAFALEDPTPKKVLKRANQAIYKQTDPNKFVALFYGLLNCHTGKLTYVNAGQPGPFLVSHGQVKSLTKGNLALGVLPSVDYVQSQISLNKGDLLFVYTDGLVEARVNHHLFGEQRLTGLLKDQGSLPPEELINNILQAAREFAQGNLRDDIAVLALRRFV